MSNIFKSSKVTKNNEKGNEKGNEKSNNFFMEKREKEESFMFKEENFPSLGSLKTKLEPIKSFSSALNHVENPKKKKKNEWGGWIIFKKDGTVIQHEDSGRYQRVRAILDKLNEDRRQIRYEKRIYEIERQKELEYYFNGPEYIESWEVNNYLEKCEKEIKESDEQCDYSDYDDYSD